MSDDVIGILFKKLFPIIPIAILVILGAYWYATAHNPHRGGLCADWVKPVTKDSTGMPLVCTSNKWKPVQ